MEIIKTIIPAGGFGTRFLPFTKAVPKEMLPLLNKPAIQCIVEEGIHSEIKDFIIITSGTKHAIADHFDADPVLEHFLKERDRLELIASLRHILRLASFAYIRQPEPRGLGHAVWTARHYIGKEYIGIMLPDDIIINPTPALAQLIKIARQEKASVVAVCEVEGEDVSSYGIVGIKKQINPSLFQVSHLVEKPSQKDAPSNLAIIGRYVLSHKIFPALEKVEPDDNGELQLTHGISHMIHNNEKVFAYKIQGIRYDIGNPIGWVKAIIGCALQDPTFAPHISKLLKDPQMLEQYTCNPAKIAETLL